MLEADRGFSSPLALSAALLESALDHLAEGICLSDLSGRALFANAAYRRLRPDARPENPPGEPGLAAAVSHLVLDRDGAPSAWLSVVEDPADSSQAERAIRESEERYRVILQSISEAVFIVNEQGVIETINDAAAAAPYVAPNRLTVGVPLEAVLPSGMARRRLETLREVLDCRAPQVIEEDVGNGDGTICLSTTVNPQLNADGSCTKVVMVSRDVTAAKEREVVLRQFSKSVLSLQEAERKRVAGELHDGLAQSLVALRVQLRQVEQGVPAGDEAQRRRVADAIDAVQTLLEDTRRIAHNLTPAILADIGLGPAIDRLVRTFSDTRNASAGQERVALDGLFTADEEIQIYRILQEVFNNIHRHAGARRVDLVVRRIGPAVEFEVRDDGVGFDAVRVLELARQDVDHQGLRGLQERAGLIGGTLVLQSTPGAGTSVVLTIPLAERADAAARDGAA